MNALCPHAQFVGLTIGEKADTLCNQKPLANRSEIDRLAEKWTATRKRCMDRERN